MYLNAIEEDVFEMCVDSKMIEAPSTYCNSLLNSLELNLWTAATRKEACL
jgi:hypothetical protein